MIRIVTDTASDITPDEARRMGVDLAPLSIEFPGVPYDAQQDTDFSEFYRLLTSERAFPKTSLPPPEAFLRVFEDARDKGEPVVAVLLSGALSGTLQLAALAKETSGYDDIAIIDTRTAIMSQRILVEYAVRLRGEGKSAPEIVRAVESVKARVTVCGMIDTLTYLYKGGRLPRTAAIAGNLLRIKPLLSTRDGRVVLIGRGRSHQAVIKFLEHHGYDPSFPVYFGYTVRREPAEKLLAQVKQAHPDIAGHTGIFPVGPSIGAHVGPGGVAIAFVKKA